MSRKVAAGTFLVFSLAFFMGDMWAGSVQFTYTYTARAHEYTVQGVSKDAVEPVKDPSGRVITYDSWESASRASGQFNADGKEGTTYQPSRRDYDTQITLTRVVHFQGNDPKESYATCKKLREEYEKDLVDTLPLDPMVTNRMTMAIVDTKKNKTTQVETTVYDIRTKVAMNNSERSADPVRYAVGDTFMEAIDLSLPNGEAPLTIGRSWLSSRSDQGSLGKGWFSSLDQRVIRGFNADIDEVIKDWENRLKELEDLWQEQQLFLYGPHGNDGYVAFLSRLGLGLRESLDSMKSVGTALEAERSLMPRPEKDQAIDTLLAELRALWGPNMPFVAMAESLCNEYLAPDWSPVLHASKASELAAMESRIETLRTVDLPRVRLEREVSRASLAINGLWHGGMETSVAAGSGWNSLQIVDSEGVVRSYKIPGDPDAGSGESIGITEIVNFFPHTVDLIPHDPLQGERVVLREDGSVERTLADGRSWLFNCYGQLVRHVASDGEGWLIEYHGDAGLPWRMRDLDSPRSLEFAYRDGKLASVTGPGGRTRLFGYNQAGQLVSVTNSKGERTGYQWGGHMLVATINPDGTGIRTSYGPDAAGSGMLKTRWNENELGMREEFEQVDGGMVHRTFGDQDLFFGHDASCLPTRWSWPDGSTRELRRDAAGRVILQRDREGRELRTEYSADGRRVVYRYPEGETEIVDLDDAGRIVAMIDRSGKRTVLVRDRQGFVVEQRFADGGREWWERDSHGRVLVWIDLDGHRREWQYDPNGFCAREIAPDGGIHQWTNDAWGLVSEYVDPLGLRVLYTRDAEGRLTSREWDDGTTERYEHDWRGNLRVRILKDGRKETCDYDATGRLVTFRDAGGRCLVVERDADGRVREEHLVGRDGKRIARNVFFRDGDGNVLRREEFGSVDSEPLTWEFSWNREGELIAETDPSGVVRTLERDRLGRIRAAGGKEYAWHGEELSRVTDPEGRGIDHVAYDAAGRLTEARDARGTRETWSFGQGGRLRWEKAALYRELELDFRGNILRQSENGNRESTTTWDKAGRLAGEVDAQGTAWRYVRDRYGHVTEAWRNDVLLFEYRWDSMDRPQWVKTRSGLEIIFVHDEAGNLTERRDSLGAVWRYEWNGDGTLARETNPQKELIQYHYDNWGRLVGIEDARGIRESWVLDPAGKVVEYRSRPGQIQTWRYDSKGEVAATRVNGGPETRFERDGSGLVLSRSHGRNQVWKQAFDSAGDLARLEGPDGFANDYLRDANGRLLSQGTGAGEVRYEYGGNGLLATERFASGEVTRFAHDKAGMLAEAGWEEGRTTWRRDGSGMMTLQDEAHTGTRQEWGWNAEGTLAWDKVNGHLTRFEYNVRGDLIACRQPDGSSIESVLDAGGREVRRKYPGGMSLDFVHDKAGVLVGTVLRKGGQCVGGEALVHDTEGRVMARIDFRGQWQAYTWDSQGRLESLLYPATEEWLALGKASVEDAGLVPETARPDFVVPSGNVGAGLSEAWELVFGGLGTRPPLGQLSARDEYGYEAEGHMAWIRHPQGRIEQEWTAGGALLRRGTTVYGWSKQGNLAMMVKHDARYDFAYDSKNRLVRVFKNDALVHEIDYDPWSRPWRERWVEADASVKGVCRSYVGTSFDVLREDLLVYPAGTLLQGAKNPKRSERFLSRSTPEPSQSVASRTYRYYRGDLVSTTSDGQTVLMLPDCRGEKAMEVVISDSESGENRKILENCLPTSPFGATLYEAMDSKATPGLAGRTALQELQLKQLGYRHYLAREALFLTLDPAMEGLPHTWRRYCDHDPINFSDPLGLCRTPNFAWPIYSGKLTSAKGMYDYYDKKGAYQNKPHYGIDVAEKEGTKIYSIADGVVRSVLYNTDGHGYSITIDHENGYTSVYSHMNKKPVQVAGDRLTRLQAIGEVGNTSKTGASTGPHLHFEIRFDGTALDPIGLLPAMPDTVKPEIKQGYVKKDGKGGYVNWKLK